MSKRVYDALAPLRQRLDNVAIVYRGEAVSAKDAALVRIALCLQCSLLYDILPNPEPSINQFYRSICCYSYIDGYDLGKEIKSVALALRRCVEECDTTRSEDRREKDFTRPLKLKYRSIICAPVSSLITKFIKDPSRLHAHELLTYVSLLEKLNFASISLEEEMVAEYDAQESSMIEWTYDLGEALGLRSIVQDWIRGFIPDFALAHFSSGANAEFGRGEANVYRKLSHIVSLPRELYMLYHKYNSDPRDLLCEDREVDRRSELQFVPKSMITNRVISKEPAALMFMQLGLKEGLYRLFDTHPFLSKCISLEDQSKSQTMAIEGSKTAKYCTFDLSAASDSVSLDLVRFLTDGTPLGECLLATRSTQTHYAGKTGVDRVWTLNKFAPMGSACCFPIEVLVFGAICEFARRTKGSRKLWRVYGDDLIIPQDYASEVAELLDDFNFTLNRRKSFSGSGPHKFREACGVEAIDGFDVTPWRLSRGLKVIPVVSRRRNKISLGLVNSWTGLVNQAAKHGFMSARSYALREMQLRLGSIFTRIPRSNSLEDCDAIFTPTALDDAMYSWSKSLQSYRRKSMVSSYDKRARGVRFNLLKAYCKGRVIKVFESYRPLSVTADGTLRVDMPTTIDRPLSIEELRLQSWLYRHQENRPFGTITYKGDRLALDVRLRPEQDTLNGDLGVPKLVRGKHQLHATKSSGRSANGRPARSGWVR